MRVSAAGFTLLGLGLLAATGCQSSAGSYASSRPSWHWPWSKRPAAAETDIAQGQPANPLPSQLAQNPQGNYAPNYYGATTGAESYAQNPAGQPSQPGHGYQPPSYGAQPTSYGAAPASQGLYDSQTPAASVAQGGGYPLNPQDGYQQQPAAGDGDPSSATAVNDDYYNSAYARQDAAGYTAGAAPAGGYDYGQADPAQPAMGYETHAGAAMPANPAMPQIGYAEPHVADTRNATGMPAAQGAPQPMSDPNYAPPGGAYAPVAPQSRNSWSDPAPASRSAGNYNEPNGFQPGGTGYTPGSNGYQPSTAAPYQAPAGPYNANPNNPSVPRYRPGSTGDYYQSGASNSMPATGAAVNSTGSAVAPANYNAAPGAAPAEVPAVYMPSATEAAANVQQ